MINNNIGKKKSQRGCAILNDYTNSGRKIDWRGKKTQSIKLSESYKRIGSDSKSLRVRSCGDFLEFKMNSNDTSSMKLHRANFCKVRLCPMCAWRRSLKVFGQVSAVMDKIDEIGNYRYIFLTLTIRNVNGDELNDIIDRLFHGFNLLTKRMEFKNAVIGYFRALEVTHNINLKSESYDTYHPHFHCVLQVNKSYFHSKYYITKKKWIRLWNECMHLDYLPSVDIRKADRAAVPEVAKYTVKSGDYIIKSDSKLTDDTVRVLDSALHGRRLYAFGGMMKSIHKELNLDNVEETDDLIVVDGKHVNDELLSVLVRYKWHVGLNNYVLEYIEKEE